MKHKSMTYVRLAGARRRVYRQRTGGVAMGLKLKADLADLASVMIDIALFALASFVALWWLYWALDESIEKTILLRYTLKNGGLLAIGCFLAIRLEWRLACLVDDCRQMASRGAIDGQMPSRQRCVLVRLAIAAGGLFAPMILLLF